MLEGVIEMFEYDLLFNISGRNVQHNLLFLSL